MELPLKLQSLLGLIAFPVIAWTFSEQRKPIRFRPVIMGIVLQLVIALLLLRIHWFQQFFLLLNNAVSTLAAATTAGTSLVFGYLGGAELPFVETQTANSYILGLRALPLIIVVSALTSLLSYWRVLPWIIEKLSLGLEKTLGVGGAVGLAAAANIFVGMTEAPLFIRDCINKLSRSELFMVMSLGMATIAGTVLIVYVNFIGQIVENAIGHLILASIISVPAAITVSLLMVPSDGTVTRRPDRLETEIHGSIDATTQGALIGMKIFLNIIALLITFVALVYLLNAILSLLPNIDGIPLSLERILGWIMAPICWLMGLTWSESITAGSLMGIKTVLNEMLAFIKLAELPENSLSPRSNLILSYALCGFANFGSLGILIGGLSTMAPERREEISQLGLRCIVSGTLATCMTESVIGVIS